MSYEEKQKNELEVIEAIYPNELESELFMSWKMVIFTFRFPHFSYQFEFSITIYCFVDL